MQGESFWKAHASLLFVGITLATSLVLIFASASLATNHPHWGTFIEHIGAIGVAASATAVFFSFREVRHSLAGSISALLIDGDVARHLGIAQRDKLRKRLLLQSLETKLDALPESLMDHIDKSTDYYLSVPHLTNYAATVVLRTDEEHPQILLRSFRCTYVIDCRHLKNGRGMYKICVRHELPDPSGQLTAEDVLKEFEFTIGAQTFHKDQVRTTSRQSGATKVMLMSFDQEVEVESETGVNMSMEMVADPSDAVQFIYSPYPTKGLRATLSYRDGLSYDLAWFKSWTKIPADFPGRGWVENMPGGITAYTHDWVLPGEGVVLYWVQPMGPTNSGHRS